MTAASSVVSGIVQVAKMVILGMKVESSGAEVQKRRKYENHNVTVLVRGKSRLPSVAGRR